jgi:hypothetical protein
VFKDGHYKVVELPEKMFVGPDMVYAAVPERDRVMTLAYTNRDATYLKRFTFGGTILNKEYFCIPPEIEGFYFFEPDTPAELFIRYKAAPYQKINQQTCNPSQRGSQRPEDARPADFDQGSRRDQQQATRAAGTRRRHDQTGVCVTSKSERRQQRITFVCFVTFCSICLSVSSVVFFQNRFCNARSSLRSIRKVCASPDEIA